MKPPATDRLGCSWGLQGPAGWTVCELPAGHDGPHWGLEDLRDGTAPVGVFWGDVLRPAGPRAVVHGPGGPGPQAETPSPPGAAWQRLARSWRRFRTWLAGQPPL